MIVDPLGIAAVLIPCEAIEHAESIFFRERVVETQISNHLVTVDVSGVDKAHKTIRARSGDRSPLTQLIIHLCDKRVAVSWPN